MSQEKSQDKNVQLHPVPAVFAAGGSAGVQNSQIGSIGNSAISGTHFGNNNFENRVNLNNPLLLLVTNPEIGKKILEQWNQKFLTREHECRSEHKNLDPKQDTRINLICEYKIKINHMMPKKEPIGWFFLHKNREDLVDDADGKRARCCAIRLEKDDNIDVTNSDFSNSCFKNAYFKGISLKGVVFDNTILKGATLDGIADLDPNELAKTTGTFFVDLEKDSYLKPIIAEVRELKKKNTIFKIFHEMYKKCKNSATGLSNSTMLSPSTTAASASMTTTAPTNTSNLGNNFSWLSEMPPQCIEHLYGLGQQLSVFQKGESEQASYSNIHY